MVHIYTFLRNKYVPVALLVIGVLGLASAGYLYIQQRQTQGVTAKSVGVTNVPSSKKLSTQTITSYTVPPPNPRYIAIPSIGVTDTPVLKLGLLQNGAIATPNNIYEAGWYDASSLPGQSGAMFIYGHVSSWTANGIFYNLKKVTAGDRITITRGDNKTYTYKVVSTKVYPYNNVNMHQVLSAVNPKVPGLNVMTCTGQVMKGTSEFNERLVVFTSLIS